MRLAHTSALAFALAAPLGLWACGDDAGGDSTTTCEAACAAAPASTCADDETLRSYAAPGTCEADGTCTYAHVDVSCPLGCEDGRCVGDPCADVTCDAPPSPCHAPSGTCRAGTCDYAILAGASCDDEDACTVDDRCRADGSCAGGARSCASPPAPSCEDAATLSVPASQGTCDDGECAYPPQLVDCDTGCEAGACVGDPCAGVTCDDPPSGCHDAPGTCVDGVCSYDHDDGAGCDDADACTTGDACHGGACEGEPKACDDPPGDACEDGDTLRTYVAQGQCEAGGECAYAHGTVTCPHGCEDGACVGDPCAGVVCDDPPADACDGATATAWAASGACDGGACGYASTETPCANGCASGACVAPTGLVISELLVNSDGFPDTDAFVEVHGPPGTALGGVTIVGVNGNGGADYVSVPLSGQLDGAGLYVLVHPDAAPWAADMADAFDARIDLQNGPDSVQLRFGDEVLDAVGYGDFGAGHAFAGEGMPHPAAAVGESLYRDADFTDTDDNLADFTTGVPSPGVATPPPPSVEAHLDVPTDPVEVGDAVAFDASGSTGPIAAYTFDFGDGTPPVSGADAVVTHTFEDEGAWTVTVTVDDGHGASDTASIEVDVAPAAVVDDPFDPGSCEGVAWTPEAALARLDGADSEVLGARMVLHRSRTCTDDGCGPWGDPSEHTISYLTWSGGVVTRYTTLPTDTTLVLWTDQGQPRLSVRHDTHVARYPSAHDEGLVFDFPPEVIPYPTMRAYNESPENQYDYRDLEAYFGRDAQLYATDGCARLVSVLPNLEGPVRTELVAVYRY